MNDPLYKKAGETEIGELGRMNEPEQLEQLTTESRFVEHDPLMEQDRMLNERTRHFEEIARSDLSAYQLAPLDELEVNRSLLAKSQSRMKAIEASGVAPGTPMQFPKAGKDSYKERKAKAKKRKKARKIVASGDEYTLEMLDQFQTSKDADENAMKDTPTGIEKSDSKYHGDGRILASFCQGHRVNKEGQPTDEKEARKMNADRKFFVDYLSGDQERRKPYLDIFTKELLEYKIDISMLSDKYVSSHIAELYKFAQKTCYFENLMKENKWYFDSLPQYQKDLIEVRINRISGPLTNYLINFCGMRGISFNSRGLLDEVIVANDTELYKSDLEDAKEVLVGVLAERDKVEKEATDKESKRERVFSKVGDRFTGIMEKQLTGLMAEQDTVSDDLVSPMRKKSKIKSDPRVLRILTPGYRVGKDGEPLDDKEAAKKQEAKQFLEAYLSGDEEKVKPHLDKVFKELLDFKLDASMITDEYVGTHLRELKEYADKCTYIQNMRDDYPGYFANLSADMQERISAQLETLINLPQYLVDFCAARGVSLNNMRLMTPDEAELYSSDSQDSQLFFKEELMKDFEKRDMRMQKLTAGGGETGAVGA